MVYESTTVGRVSRGQKSLLSYHPYYSLVLKARHLDSSTFWNFHRLGVPYETLVWIPLGFGILYKLVALLTSLLLVSSALLLVCSAVS